jgi:succinoglycan biosynthesis protein ExoA
MSDAVDVSVLIPVLNEERHLPAALEAMRAQELEGTCELIFVDGRSSDGTRALLERLAAEDPRIRVLENPARRTAAGLNVGLRAARGRYVARMDAHAVYPPQYLRRGIARLQRGDDVVWVTGPQIPEGDGAWSRRVALALGSWIGRGGQSDKWPGAIDGRPEEEVPLTTSVFTGVWERAQLLRLGGWDEGWPVNQDAEMAARVLARGGGIVCRPDMGARYIPRDTLRGLARQYGRYGFYRAKTTLRHPGSLPKSRLLPVAVLLSALAVLLPWAPARWLGLSGLVAYLAGLAAVTWRARERAGEDTPALPVVFATMHLSWAVGFLLGLVRNLPRLRTVRTWPAPIREDEVREAA